MIFCIDKPVGITSNQAVQIVKRGGKFKRVGHAGTLDPAASGVLVIGTDDSTKELDKLLLDEKEYVASIRFGVHTETYDAIGFVLNYEEAIPDFQAVAAAFESFPSQYQQTPPSYSALKVRGRRAYDLARNGEQVILQARTARILQKEILGYSSGVLSVRLVVEKGFYVRSFAVDLAARIGTYGTLVSLVRTRSGCFSLTSAKSLGDFGFVTRQFVPMNESVKAQVMDLLRACQIEFANEFSRQPYTLGGMVVKGVQKARLLGYPTANLLHEREDCLAGDGVYRSHTSYDGLLFRSLTFIGFGNAEKDQGHKFESHLFNFHGDLYGKRIETSLIGFIRKNLRFPSTQALMDQINADVTFAKKV